MLRGMSVRLLQHGVVTNQEELGKAIRVRMQEINEGKESIVWHVYIARKPPQ
jgi:hypothetical protein